MGPASDRSRIDICARPQARVHARPSENRRLESRPALDVAPLLAPAGIGTPASGPYDRNCAVTQQPVHVWLRDVPGTSENGREGHDVRPVCHVDLDAESAQQRRRGRHAASPRAYIPLANINHNRYSLCQCCHVSVGPVGQPTEPGRCGRLRAAFEPPKMLLDLRSRQIAVCYGAIACPPNFLSGGLPAASHGTRTTLTTRGRTYTSQILKLHPSQLCIDRP